MAFGLTALLVGLFVYVLSEERRLSRVEIDFTSQLTELTHSLERLSWEIAPLGPTEAGNREIHTGALADLRSQTGRFASLVEHSRLPRESIEAFTTATVAIDEVIAALDGPGTVSPAVRSASTRQASVATSEALAVLQRAIELKRTELDRTTWIAFPLCLATLIGMAVLVLAPTAERAEEETFSLLRDREQLDAEAQRMRTNVDEAARRSRQMLSMLEDLDRQTSALKQAEERFRSAVEAAPNAMLMVDEGGEIVLVNHQAETLFGYSREELVGSSVDRLVPSGIREEHPTLRASFYRSPEARLLGQGKDLRGLRKDGSEVPIEIGLNPMQTSEGIFVLSSVIDISERKEAEEAIRGYARELERSNEDLAQFAYVASHDLREPLRMVTSFLDLLESEYGDDLDEEARRYVDFAVDGAVRMDQLIQDLLEYSRVGRSADGEKLDLGALVDDILRDLEPAIRESQAIIRVRGELPEEIFHHPIELRRVLQNLIGNALKFSGAEAPRVELSARASDDGEAWIIDVRDHGIGIDPKYNERIFGLFQRLHTREEHPGTGIGLAIVKKIVEQRGGWIRASQPDDGGSRFEFSIPIPAEER